MTYDNDTGVIKHRFCPAYHWTAFWAVGALCCAALGCGGSVAAGTEAGPQAPATVTDRSRDVTQTNDFLRLIFVTSQVKPDHLGGPNAFRVFAAATAFVEPPLPLADVVAYPGLVDQPDQDLVAMRCMPSDPTKVDPILATWPNVFDAVRSDFAPTYTCPAPSGSAENAVYCMVKDFIDAPSATAVVSLAAALNLGVTLFADADRAEVLRRRYGIYPAFSGLGFAVKGSGDGQPMPAVDVLRRSVTPEYLLRNVSFRDGGCFCLRVPPYAGRETAALDVDFIVQRGGFGECATVPRLEYARH